MSDSRDLGTNITSWFINCPLLTRALLVTLPILFIATVCGAELPFACIPAAVIHGGVQRLVLAHLMHFNIIELLLMMLLGGVFLAQIESNTGTVETTMRFFILSVAINICIVLSVLLVWALIPSWGMILLVRPYSGLFSILICLLHADCLKTPDVPRLVFPLPFTVPACWFAPLLVAIFSLLSVSIDWAGLAGLIVAVLTHYGPLKYLLPSAVVVQRIENAMPFVKEVPGFVTSSRALGYTTIGRQDTSSTDTSQRGSFYQPNARSSVPAGFKVFSGHGHKLGSTDDLDAPDRGGADIEAGTQGNSPAVLSAGGANGPNLNGYTGNRAAEG
ncbi:unnamed protein product [Vitrella brassicaformis CCMP3155]|uniref:Peptidase S54 rhomboid domain-containing protein n=2 Tax=Vitrella brassicaformis TaxID=1169539 RepID=A0A0G4F108_VITBC|nr:unnamed protein product [Vitrella brassicaformis CCMP3155]|eukprot:CEM05372.1 unnamed protein product [Vitrella brassicaformis CCMP3155]